MRKGFAPILVVIAVLAVSVLGGGGYLVINKVIAPQTKSQPAKESKSGASPSPSLADGKAFQSPKPLVKENLKEASNKESTSGTNPASTASPSPAVQFAGGPTVYTQPQGKYEITLPDGWVVNSINATTTYSTTKFTGPNGYVAITFGSGKDPLGGCSEKSAVVLFDRTISGCFLLQKDGSQILTRTYTKDAAGIDFTIEAYINPPLSTNKPVVLDVVKTIDIE